jgi:hypothetical protein
MRSRIRIVGLALACSLILPVTASAITFPFNVKANRDFTAEIFIFGSVQVLLDAQWNRSNSDLDMAVLCDQVPLGSFSAEERLETLSFGAADGGEGLFCLVTVYSFRGNGKGALNIRLTGSEQRVSSPAYSVVTGAEKPAALQELIDRQRAAKGRARR